MSDFTYTVANTKEAVGTIDLPASHTGLPIVKCRHPVKFLYKSVFTTTNKWLQMAQL